MRQLMPPPFKATMTGPDGPYELSFTPYDEWDGKITTTIAGVPMVWQVVRSDEEPDGTFTLSGMTVGSDEIWNDQFWFELVVRPLPRAITYFGDRVVWRVDAAAEQLP